MEVVTLHEVYNLTDFATDNLWYMDFIKMPETPVRMSQDDLNIRCKSFTMPSTAVKDLSVTLHNHVKHQSTTTTQPTEITIPFIETMDMRTTDWLVSWREVCSRTNTNFVSLPEARRADIQFYSYNAQHQINYTYRINYVELRSIGGIDYADGSTPGAIIRSATFNVGEVIELG